MTDTVPFTDIRVHDETIDDVVSVLESGRFVKGPLLERFEEQFAEECGVDHAVGVSSGTAALLLALKSAGIGPGDQVFVPGHTFFATVSPVVTLGAEPVFVDVDPDAGTIDPVELADAVEDADQPAAVVPVHIYGGMADMTAVNEIAAEHDLFVLEDACQAHFGTRDGETAGAAGDAGAFSFYPSKNMTVGGDGGMITTDNAQLADRMRALRNHGRNDDGEHVRLGLNYRLDETNAAVGLGQLDRIRTWNENRNQAAQRYTDQLSDIDEVVTPYAPPETFHVYHLYVIQVPDREQLAAYLSDHGIENSVHYETPAHQHSSIESWVGETTLPRTESLVDNILSLPMHPRIADEEIDRVCAAIEEYYR